MSPTQREIVEVAQALRRHAILLRQVHRKVLGSSLTPAQVAVMQFIRDHEGTTPTDLAQFTGLTAGTITSLLDGLEREGFIQRSRSTQDRRVVLLSLAERASAFLADLVQEAQAEIGRLFQDWSSQDVRAFTHYLDRLTRASVEVPA